MSSVFQFLAQLVNLLLVVMVIRIVLSWVAPRATPYDNPAMRVLYGITEPVMAPFRRLIPPVSGIDFSPMLLFFLLSMLHNFLLSLAY